MFLTLQVEQLVKKRVTVQPLIRQNSKVSKELEQELMPD